MAKAVVRQSDVRRAPKNHFTVGINDDVTTPACPGTRRSPPSPPGCTAPCSIGLGADGTIGANKNSIKIIGNATDNYAQGYFVYDSKKSGHLHDLAPPIRQDADQEHLPHSACELRGLPQVQLPGEARHALPGRRPGGVFLLNSPYAKDEVWEKIPVEVQKQIIDKKLQFYVIDATNIADEVGLRGRINAS